MSVSDNVCDIVCGVVVDVVCDVVIYVLCDVVFVGVCDCVYDVVWLVGMIDCMQFLGFDL